MEHLHLVPGKYVSMSLKLSIRFLPVARCIMFVMFGCTITHHPLFMSDILPGTQDVTFMEEQWYMEQDTIIIHGSSTDIMHGLGHGDLMFITILGPAGLLAQAGDNRMAGLCIIQKMNILAGGDRRNIIRFIMLLRNQSIAKDIIQCIDRLFQTSKL